MVSRCYCFTLNNYTEEETAELSQCKPPLKGMWWGREVGENGTPHLQGYMTLTKPMRITGIAKIPGCRRMHLEVRRGTHQEAITYCGKESPLEKYGDTTRAQGSRSDLDRARRLATEGGMRAVTLTEKHQGIVVAEKFLTYHEEPRDWKPRIDWYWGPTNTFKSSVARAMLEDKDVYTKNNGTKWWNGYDRHEAVIIDDFRDSWWSLTEMLSLLDRYEKQIEVKNGMRQFVPKWIIVTSAKHPASLYGGCGEDVQQLLRRIDLVTEFCNEVGRGNTEALPPPMVDDDIEEVLKDLGCL